jgi:ubiquinone/menaquinone biosynthesis C-methylase UbiE
MDKQTLAQYNSNAKLYADQYDNYKPEDQNKLILTYFIENEPTADIGCGSGRDTNFLHENGFPTIGFDASTGMLEVAKERYSHIEFNPCMLPELDEIKDEQFANILCSAVLMHLPSDKLELACDNLYRILKPGGILLTSFRSSRDTTARESDGRLYSSISGSAFLRYFEHIGASLLYKDEIEDDKREHVSWMTFIFEKENEE